MKGNTNTTDLRVAEIEPKSDTISGTTTGSGNIVTNISLLDKIIIAAYSSAQDVNTYCDVIKQKDIGNALFHVSIIDGSAYANKSVTVTYYYIEI